MKKIEINLNTHLECCLLYTSHHTDIMYIIERVLIINDIIKSHACSAVVVFAYAWLTKPSMDRGSERKVPHIGTETRSKLLREAAVRNIGQWAQA